MLMVVFAGLFNLFSMFYANATGVDNITEYGGMCDASAGLAIDSKTFVVASDEDNILRFYRHSNKEPIQTFDLTPFLQLDAKHPEADIEAVTRVGDRMYWITSHARNKNAKLRRSRHKLFATRMLSSRENIDDKIEMKFIGQPYESLIEDIISSPSLKVPGLERASMQAAKAAGGLNIEGLSSRADGSLLIAFRNPLIDGKALLITLENPQGVIAGETARFGAAIMLSLQGLGVRAMSYVDHIKRYIIVAGSYDHRDDFRLFFWSGRKSDDPVFIKELDIEKLHPEAVIVYPQLNKIQLLSDDGMKRVAGGRCKNAAKREQYFRSMWLLP